MAIKEKKIEENNYVRVGGIRLKKESSTTRTHVELSESTKKLLEKQKKLMGRLL
ncbi:MAG: hypothetical protein ACI35O_16060 [Bacillaceae bacterium]